MADVLRDEARGGFFTMADAYCARGRATLEKVVVSTVTDAVSRMIVCGGVWFGGSMPYMR